SGIVEYLYGIGYLFSGPNEFVTEIKDKINFLSSSSTFEEIEKRVIGLGDCPLSSEEIKMMQTPFTLRDFGGIFIIVLIGIVIAFTVAGIEFLLERYPMYRQRQKDNMPEFGSTYVSEVISIQSVPIQHYTELIDRLVPIF
ncbi:unnamed protein product, partial [Hymenolepis diminuta]|uniref:PBPe domain-containing protein n=1 Tax=Hymenolepis diminuta TaxID=6216 RepID=A0A0R3SM00_HYMDI